jgi:OOP family OmpA-OmpF porin
MRLAVLSIATVAGLALSSAAFAQGYAGIAVGQSKFSLPSGTTGVDSTDTGAKIFGGYKFTPNIAGEVTYIDFGKAKGDGGSLKASALGAGVAFSGELAPGFTAVGRLGVARVKADATGGPNTSSTQPYFGLGLGYWISKTISIDVAYDITKWKLDDGEVSDKENVQLFSIGLSFAF